MNEDLTMNDRPQPKLRVAVVIGRFSESQIENQIEQDELEDSCWFDDDDELLPDTCPNCGHEYDEIDYEYQICHICNFQNSNN